MEETDITEKSTVLNPAVRAVTELKKAVIHLPVSVCGSNVPDDSANRKNNVPITINITVVISTIRVFKFINRGKYK